VSDVDIITDSKNLFRFLSCSDVQIESYKIYTVDRSSSYRLNYFESLSIPLSENGSSNLLIPTRKTNSNPEIRY
jgi:hypothetical protein